MKTFWSTIQGSKSLPASVFMFFISIYLYFPGLMSVDSVTQLEQAYAHQYLDWHPPIMSVLWALLNHIYFGPAPFLILHNLVFWGALGLFAEIIFETRTKASCFIIGIGLFPTVITQTGIIWKDVGFSFSLFFIAVALFAIQERRTILARRKLLVALIPFLFYATAVRANSIPAIPLVLFWALSIYWPDWTFLKRAFLSVATTFLFVIAVLIFNRAVTSGESAHLEQQIKAYDLVGITMKTGQILVPEYVKQKQLVGHNEDQESVPIPNILRNLLP